MDDFVVDVRQIGSYPFKPIVAGTDTFVFQEGGLGGPYRSTNLAGMLANLSGTNGGLAIGFPLPDNGRGLIASHLLTPSGSTQGYNWYRDGKGQQRFFRAGNAGMWSFANGTLSFDVTVSGIQDQPIRSPIDWQQILQLSIGGQIEIAGQIRVGRDPLGAQEVTTLDWVRKNTVASFNGRSGAVQLSIADIAPLVRSPDNPGLDTDRIATCAWVQEAISFRLTDLLVGYPFVTSFNGRKGDVTFRIDDWHRAAFRRGARPKTPTPPPYDASFRIANTRWVEQRLDDIALKPGPQGPVGPQGPQGSGFNVKGAVADQSSLPATGNEVGDVWITQDTNTGYLWDGTQWQEIGLISPSSRVYVSDTPPGTAQNGDLWWSSANGELSVWYDGPGSSQWVIANTGFDGPAGPEGPPGPAGPNVWIGTTIPPGQITGRLWYNPSTQVTQVWDGTAWQIVSEQALPPGATVSVGPVPPAAPNDGDLWWQSNDGELMVWYVGPSGGQWVIANAGATGAPGPPGVAGPPGPPGNQGVQGPPGTGLNFLGSVATQAALPPTGNLNGDMYVTLDTSEMFVWSDTTSAWEHVGVGGGIAEAPTDGRLYGRQNTNWVELIDDGTW